eukprot:scaffold31516_cov16-Prasinocladus_malaysianus.AAC.1
MVSPLLRRTLCKAVQLTIDIFWRLIDTPKATIYSATFFQPKQGADCSLVDSWLDDQAKIALARRNALCRVLRIPVADIADIAAV